MRYTFLVVAAFITLMGSSSVNAQATKRLFSILDTPEKSLAPSSLASVKESKIGIDQHISEGEILIPLFDGKTYRAVEKGSEVRAIDDRTWRGKLIEGTFDGDVVITFRKGFVSGLIYSPDAVYEIVARGDSHYLVQLDQSLFAECGGDVKGEPAVATPGAAPEGGALDSGDRIDVLVVYTTATKNFLGGDAQAQALAQQAIDATNTAYINSKIRQRVRLVHSEEFAYVETTGSADLSALRSNAGIQTLRNTHNADMVAEISEVTGLCGIGYLMGGTGGNANNAFTVTARSCAVGNLSFAHELGHNMGSQHNPESGSGATYSYGYGHYVNGSYRTVMSYVDPCTSGCTRRPYFSNPNVFFAGVPTGIANARDNARSINNTADTIANYRFSPSAIQLSNFDAGTVMQRGIRRNLTWNTGNVSGNIRIEYSTDEGTTWQTLIANTPDDGSEGVTFWTRPSKMARVRAVSINAPHVTDSSTGNIFIR
jgi:hypothetical protein